MAKDFEMNENHKAILKYLAGTDSPVGPGDIEKATGIEKSKIANLVKKLKDNGYLSSPVRCKYAITAQGREKVQY